MADKPFEAFNRGDEYREDYAAGEEIFHEGETGESLYVVSSGAVDLRSEGHLLAEAGPGEVFGEMVLAGRAQRSATAIAHEDTTIYRVDRERFDREVKADPGLAREFMHLLGDRLAATNVRLVRHLATFGDNLGDASLNFTNYETEEFFDELIQADGAPRPGAAILAERIDSLPPGDLIRRQQAAEQALMDLGITFNVYGDEAGVEKIFPFDIIPRVVEASDWTYIEKGLQQRIRALNDFIQDIYHDQRIVSAGVVPAQIINSAQTLLPPCIGLDPPRGIWCHITGTDLVRDSDGQMYVLEDNLRCPSGVSYVLENRTILKATFPQVFEDSKVRPVEDYPSRLLETLQYLAPEDSGAPTVAVLTPGIFNSAYFEHAFLAQQMGAELVEGRDLVVENSKVYMRTSQGLKQVDVIYRRVDDDFLDPLEFQPDSMLDVPGLMEAYRSGSVALANAPGTGIADDKAIYAYVPQMIKYYLGEDMLLPNVPTFICDEDSQRQHVLENLDKLVVKETNNSGGYGMLIGPHSTQAEREDFAVRIKADPRKYIAQPTLALSRAPVIVGDHLEGRHVDLRPYILYGRDIYVLPGGLTRVALLKGSLVVNSSQGGGSKDSASTSTSICRADTRGSGARYWRCSAAPAS